MTPVPLPIRLTMLALLAAAVPAVAAPDRASSSSTPAANVANVANVAAAQRASIVAGTYRGSFGSTPIELTLTLDADTDDSVHGWYTLGDKPGGARVLLAGEVEDEALSLEESHNGVDVSGHWDAVLSGDGFSGQWSDINGENLVDVQLHRVSTDPARKTP